MFRAGSKTSSGIRHGRRKTGTSRPWPNAGRSTAFMKYIVTSIYNMNCELDRKTGLGPLLCNGPKVLILGSLPGDRSLELQEYYGHPQNRFWKVIAAIHGLPCPADYAGKKRTMPDCALGHLPCRKPPGQHGFGHTRRRVQRHRGAAPALPVNKDNSSERQRCGQRFRQISVLVSCGLQLRSDWAKPGGGCHRNRCRLQICSNRPGCDCL